MKSFSRPLWNTREDGLLRPLGRTRPSRTLSLVHSMVYTVQVRYLDDVSYWTFVLCRVFYS